MAKYTEMSLIEFIDCCGTEEQCREKLIQLRWPEGHKCEKCGSMRYSKINGRNEYYCMDCKTQFSLKKGTIMEGTKQSIRTWFCAIFLIARDKRGISALALSRELNVNYKSARLMSHNIKNAMSQREMEYMLEGIIEMDEFYIGKGSNGKRGRGTNQTKVLISMSKSEKGKPQYLKLEICEDLKSDTINDFVKRKIKVGSTIISDGYKSYNDLLTLEMKHKIEISGEDNQYLSLHTIISNVKSFVNGTYHGLAKEDLQLCLDEFCYRFNRRFCFKSLFESALTICLFGRHIKYKDLRLG